MALSSNEYALNVQKMETILAETTATKVPKYQVMAIFWKVTQSQHFLKKCKGETKRNFSKIAQKVALVWKAQKHSGGNDIIL